MRTTCWYVPLIWLNCSHPIGWSRSAQCKPEVVVLHCAKFNALEWRNLLNIRKFVGETHEAISNQKITFQISYFSHFLCYVNLMRLLHPCSLFLRQFADLLDFIALQNHAFTCTGAHGNILRNFGFIVAMHVSSCSIAFIRCGLLKLNKHYSFWACLSNQ